MEILRLLLLQYDTLCIPGNSAHIVEPEETSLIWAEDTLGKSAYRAMLILFDRIVENAGTKDRVAIAKFSEGHVLFDFIGHKPEDEEEFASTVNDIAKDDGLTLDDIEIHPLINM